MNDLNRFEDTERLEKITNRTNQTSPGCDLVYYPSTRDPSLMLAMRVQKPEKPGFIRVQTHGWHMSIPRFAPMDAPSGAYLQIDVDMRGRAFSDGAPDCNGWELYDVIDAVAYAKQHYAPWISNPEVVFFAAGSGGGGNAYAIACKFPDYFAQVTALCGISDYRLWYDHDAVGEFRDEMNVWIGDRSHDDAYRARSGIDLLPNLCAPLAIVHGETDCRVPCEQARRFVARAAALGKSDRVTYLELPGVGAQGHWSNITPEQERLRDDFCASAQQTHCTPVQIPRRGTMIVGGYLFTKAFSVVLDSIDDFGKVTYDLDAMTFQLDRPGTITVLGK